MGLCIYCKFRFRGSEAELMEKLKKLQGEFWILGVKEVTPIWRVVPERFNDEPYTRSIYPQDPAWLRSWMITSHLHFMFPLKKRGEGTYFQSVTNSNAIGFSVDVIEGCEPFDVTFSCRHSEQEGIKGWQGHMGIKTQYSDEFIKAHALVCQMIDTMKQVGFRVFVKDDGYFYQSGRSNNERNYVVLDDTQHKYDTLIRCLGKTLNEVMEEKKSPFYATTPRTVKQYLIIKYFE